MSLRRLDLLKNRKVCVGRRLYIRLDSNVQCSYSKSIESICYTCI